MLLFARNTRRELREVYKAAEMIQTAESPRHADILTGYAIGIIDEKKRSGKLTHATADAIAEMVTAVGQDVFSQLKKGSEDDDQDKDQEAEKLVDYMMEI